MHNPPHPGELLDDYLGDLSLSEAARRIGVPLETLTRIRRGQAPITDDVAARLAGYFGTSSELWSGMQIAHDQ